MNSPDSTLPLPPERLAVLDRLPEGVEFSLVKLILSAAPPFTRTRLWTDRESHDPLRARFRTQTYDQVDRALDKVAAALMRLPQERQPVARQRLDDLRFEWAGQVMDEVAGLPRLPGAKVVDTRSVDPLRQGTPLVATGLDGPGTVIDVWRLTDELPVLVERWALPAMLMPWREGDPVPWVDRANALLRGARPPGRPSLADGARAGRLALSHPLRHPKAVRLPAPLLRCARVHSRASGAGSGAFPSYPSPRHRRSREARMPPSRSLSHPQ